jgi:hypothetical protein
MTLGKTLDRYLEARKDLSPKSVAGYHSMVERHLAPWMDLPLREITGDTVEERHRAIKLGVDRGNGQAAAISRASAPAIPDGATGD